MNTTLNTKRGLIRTIIIIVIALIVLGYFGFNVRDIVASPIVQDNLGYVWGFAVDIWHNYIQGPAEYLWGIFKNLFWDSFIDNLTHIKNGEPTDLQLLAPSVEPYATSTTP